MDSPENIWLGSSVSSGYRNSPVMHPMVPETFKPMLFVEGEKVPFPAPWIAVAYARHARGAFGAWPGVAWRVKRILDV